MALTPKREGVWNRAFLLINIVLFTASAGLAIFFDFQQYLESLHIPKHWIGLLISADGLAGLVVQIIITPLLHASNARKGMIAGICILCLALFSYRWAVDTAAILVVRLLHGCGFVVLASSLMAALVHVIPPGRSGLAFGIISTTRLLPYAFVPPLLGLVARGADDFGSMVLAAGVGIMGLLPLIALLHPKADSGVTVQREARQPLRMIIRNAGELRVMLLLIVTLLLSSGFAVVFFYIKQYAVTLGADNAGLFFGIATALMIASRLMGSSSMDRIDKRRTAMAALTVLVAAFLLLALGQKGSLFLVSAVLAGLGWGIAIPLVSALIFDISDPMFRGTNINFSMVMGQAGFFVGPMLGGVALAVSGYAAIFAVCGVATLTGILLLMLLKPDRSAA